MSIDRVSADRLDDRPDGASNGIQPGGTPPAFSNRRQRPTKEYYVQLSTRVRISLKELLDDYHAETGESIQDTIDRALVSYFEGLGWDRDHA